MLLLDEAAEQLRNGMDLVSASFAIPYSARLPGAGARAGDNCQIIDFLIAIDVKEIHGYRLELGLRVFTDVALGRQRTVTALGGMARTSDKAQGSSDKAHVKALPGKGGRKKQEVATGKTGKKVVAVEGAPKKKASKRKR